MKLSVICPVYNEERYITKILDFFVNSLPLEKELIVIDGQSDDTLGLFANLGYRFDF